MAKDIKGAFQIFLQVIDNEKYKYNSNSDLIDIFSKDSSVVDELKKIEKYCSKSITLNY